MKRSFSFSDINRLIDDYRKADQRQREISEVGEYESEVRKAAVRYVDSEAMAMMEDIAVEELNRDKKGIRVKALRDHGYSNYADILTARDSDLSAVRGISEDTAYKIMKCVEDVYGQAKESVRLKLNADDRSVSATRIVTALSRYHEACKIASDCEGLDDKYRESISRDMDDIKPATGLLRWLFSSGTRKQRAEDAYQSLTETIQGEYGLQLGKLSDRRRNLKFYSESDAWDDFQKQPVKYNNTVEKLVPGLLGNGDSMYGLPKELAGKIQDEDFFPDGLRCELRRYQELGVKYILHQGRVLLGDEMGLGKTVQAIASMVSLRNTGSTHFVVVCPASVMINWCREIERFSLLSVIKVHGTTKQAAIKEWMDKGGVAVTTYETTSAFSLPDDFRFGMLVVDEAHYIKNPSAKRSVSVRKLSEHADRMLFMTGTPIENNVDEMIRLISILQPKIARKVSNIKALSFAAQFREKIAPVYYRRKREDVLTELPELVESREWCRLGKVEREAYEQAVLKKSYNDARRVSWSVDDLKYSSKAGRMMEIIADAKADGRKVIVFSYFLDTISKISAMLGSQCTEPINGSVTPAKRQEIIDGFDKAPAGQVLVSQIVAGGTGLNIQSASVVIICEPQLKPSIESQAISRAYRMGQARNVLVYRLLASNTVDERVTDLLEEKQTVFDAFADKSVAAQKVEVDKKTFGNIIQEEIDRINGERKSKVKA